MEKFSSNKKKEEKSDLKGIGRPIAFGAALAAGVISHNNTDESSSDYIQKDTTKIDGAIKNSLEYEKPEIKGDYDAEKNTFTYKKENVGKESLKDLTLKEQLSMDIESNNPDRFFNYEKYENYSEEAKKFASWITETYNNLEEDEDFAPKDVFTDEYYMAIALTESGGDGQAESSAGAIGAMQLKPLAVRDLSRVLGVLKRRGADIDYFNEGSVLDGNELAIEVLEMSKHDYPLNISMGKTYLNGVHNTYPEFSEDRDLLTTSYNFGARGVKRVMEGEIEYSEEAAGYAPKVNLYEENILAIKKTHSYLNNREVRDIARDYGHHRGQITQEYINSKLMPNKEIASL